MNKLKSTIHSFKLKQNLHFCALKNIKALCKAFVYASGGIGAGFFFGMDFTIMIGRPMTINATIIKSGENRRVPPKQKPPAQGRGAFL